LATEKFLLNLCIEYNKFCEKLNKVIGFIIIEKGDGGNIYDNLCNFA